jgi:NAD(P)-dependent dehydrogenase (short-subunit alcohol dehydrogenase family)
MLLKDALRLTLATQLGNLSYSPASDIKLDVFDKTIETNVKGTMLCMRAVSKAMATQESLSYESRHGQRSLGRGSIVNLGSLSSLVGAAGMMAYTASKHAVLGMTKVAGKHLSPSFYYPIHEMMLRPQSPR